MSWTKYNIKELAKILGVTEEHFHRIIKNSIKNDYQVDLKRLGINNPDILLDQNYLVRLVDPRDSKVFFDTELEIYAYIE